MRPLACTLALAAFVSTASTAQPDRSHLAALTVDELKLMYLECDRHARQTMLDSAEAAHCSMAYEELKQRGFGGDFGRLLAWWQAQQRADARRSAQDNERARRLH
jgi:hypothetical protein